MNVLVVGAGKSGQSAREFLERLGHSVTVFDKHVDFCVVSPGVKTSSEIDLAFAAGGKPKSVVAVTGTNGKTTVVNMIAAAVGKTGVLCGNVGVPATAVDLRGKTAIVEVSSFQLEIPPRNIRPDVAVVLNITQDHLERHGTMADYVRCKARLCADAKAVVLNFECRYCREIGADLNRRTDPPEIVWFSGGNHRDQNLAAVRAVCGLLGLGSRAVSRAEKYLAGTHGHRIETVAKIGAVEFINDSKATNIAATLAACESISKPINLILGGVPKGQDFRELFAKLPRHVRNVFVFGLASEKIIRAALAQDYDLWFEISRCRDLAEATTNAARAGEGERAVLLSPACSSFDMFLNYEDRGNHFKEIVKSFEIA
jgi:UDP-N-acetylmuramoylalanine--D-glutamate ligase